MQQKITLHHHGVARLLAGEITNFPVLHHLATTKDGHAVADHFKFAQQMAVHENSFSPGAQVEHERADVFAAYGIHTIGWFVQKNDVGIIDERLGQADPLFHSLAEGRQPIIAPAFHAHGLQKLPTPFDPHGTGDAGESSGEIDQIERGEVGGILHVLG